MTAVEESKSKLVRLDDLLVEAESPREGTEKRLFTFDDSLKSIDQRGLQRHLRPDEAFRILIDAIENPNPRYKSIKEDMLSSYGEWLSMAWIFNNNRLTTYRDPSNLVFKDDEYLVRGPKLEHSGERTFTLPKGFDTGFIPLGELPRNLVTYLYSRPVGKLPKEIRSNAAIYLPDEGILRPFDRSGLLDVNEFDAYGDYDGRASRGVRVARVRGKAS